MSGFYRRVKDGWVPRSHVKPHSRAWQAARDKRKESRVHLSSLEHWQPRDKQGFILKVIDGRTVMYDPGEIDRWLWWQAHFEPNDT